jgi:transcriptional regulator with XRE-family HTH domain
MPANRSARLPEQRVGEALRNARTATGISLREAARRLNYASHSVLSEYENGARMPSESVVEGYERLLRLEPGTLTGVLEDANIERHGDAWAKRRVHVPAAAAADVTATPASPFPEQPVADGSDPDAAGCSADAVTVHSRRIALTERRTVIGHVELRYNSRTRAAWGRFEGYGFLDHLAGRGDPVEIVVEVLRHSDGARVSTKEQYCFDYVWGELVTVDSGLFQARATVLIGDRAVARGETDARRLA